MKKLKMIAAAMVLVAMVGCATSPFIDESLREFDAHPMTSLLGVAKPLPPTIAPLGREHIIGRWAAAMESVTRISGGDELKYYEDVRQALYGPRKVNEVETYDFRSDGTYVSQDMSFPRKIEKKTALGNYPQHLGTKRVYEGEWSYDNGTLHLKPRKMTTTYYSDDKPFQGPDTIEIDTLSCPLQVCWISDQALRLVKPSSDALLSDYLKKHDIVSRRRRSYDDFGRETERLIYIDGSHEGRETGMITETVRAPAFFKREEK